MPMWRCPHCATPQAETARCWVCHRSSTACGACRHFRRAVAGQLGYCGLDRQRQPLTGRRDPAVLGGRRRHEHQRAGPAGRRPGLAARHGRSANGRSPARLRRGRIGARRHRVRSSRSSWAPRPPARRAGACGATPRPEPLAAPRRRRSQRSVQVGGSRSQRDLDGHLLPVTQDLHVHRLARRELGEGRVERMLLVDDLVLDADDDVAVLDPRRRRPACRLDAGDRLRRSRRGRRRARRPGRAGCCSSASCRVMLTNWMPRYGRASFSPATAWAMIGRAMSIGMAKPIPLLFVGDGRVDADHVAVRVEQRAAGVARVDRGIGLDEVRQRSGCRRS